jgi:hypothetical protein
MCWRVLPESLCSFYLLLSEHRMPFLAVSLRLCIAMFDGFTAPLGGATSTYGVQAAPHFLRAQGSCRPGQPWRACTWNSRSHRVAERGELTLPGASRPESFSAPGTSEDSATGRWHRSIYVIAPAGCRCKQGVYRRPSWVRQSTSLGDGVATREAPTGAVDTLLVGPGSV